MTKLAHSLTLLAALVAGGALAGCDLYFHGGHDKGEHWNYCGSDGYYTCTGDNCTWTAATCPNNGSGSECKTSADCASGCYCTSAGVCEEGGFCTQPSDCGTGYHCNTDRSSCEPDPTPPACTCTSDADAVSKGYGYCDETTGTCQQGSDPNGTCKGAVTCATAAPSCPEHQVPTIANGCYTGACEDIASCGSAPTCAALTHEDDCLGRSADCSAVYTGINCQKPDGSACHTGDANCTCQSFQFYTCAARTTSSARMVRTTDGEMLTGATVAQ